MSEHERLLAGAAVGADGYASRLGAKAHPIIRWAGALRAGYLPANAQLYVGLHKVAGLLDGYSASRASSSSSSSGATGWRQEDWQSTERASQVLFRDSAELLREIGRWISSPDAEVEVQDDPDGEETRKVKVPDGNSREQLQRLWFHAHRVRTDAEAGEASFGLAWLPPIGTDCAHFSDLPESDKTKETAREAGQDASEAIDSLGKLVVCAVTSGECVMLLLCALPGRFAHPFSAHRLQQIATQLTLTVRDMVADSADNVHDAAQSLEVQAGAVADVMRPDGENLRLPGVLCSTNTEEFHRRSRAHGTTATQRHSRHSATTRANGFGRRSERQAESQRGISKRWRREAL